MIIEKSGFEESEDVITEIEAEGTIYISHQWIPIETSVVVYKETDNSVYGSPSERGRARLCRESCGRASASRYSGP